MYGESDDVARADWLRGLKVGDEVAIHTFGAGTEEHCLATVIKLTKTLIKVRVGKTLWELSISRSDGYEKTNAKFTFRYHRIVPVDQTVVASIRRGRLLRYVEKHLSETLKRVKSLSLEELEQIAAWAQKAERAEKTTVI
jgi:hypothetical protein